MTRSVDLYDQPFCFNIERHPDSQPVDHQLSKIQSYYLQIHSTQPDAQGYEGFQPPEIHNRLHN